MTVDRQTLRGLRPRNAPEPASQSLRYSDLDGVMVFSPEGKPLAHIRLPERCANLRFGGPKNNRVYMTACHSVYALYVESHGAV
jgi:sugar lactone lactonase YvrE